MAETEVESILREIRERVISQQSLAPAGRPAIAKGTNGSAGAADSQLATPDNETAAAESLALIRSHLTTTARAWDRLPPLVSNRSGLAARLELWLKRHLKRATRWYAWEQVNFNAAVHQALTDILQVISVQDRQLQKLRVSLDAANEARQAELERYQHELQEKTENLRVLIETQVNAQLGRELRERLEFMQDEQRVSFRQLALENSEAAVLEDRTRRQTEALLADLKRRLEHLEGRKS